MRLISTLMKMFTLDTSGEGVTPQAAYRVKGTKEVKDKWERNITDLADGKSIDEALDAMFYQEVKAGA